MSYIKTPKELKLITEGGRKMGEILDKLVKSVQVGMSAWDVDQMAEKMIIEAGGRPAFKGYTTHKSDVPFPSTICASINEELVHGIATKEKVLKDGDIFSIDIGMEYPFNEKGVMPARGWSASGGNNEKLGRGYFTDTALTIAVGKIPEETQKLLDVTKEALEIGIRQVKIGNTVASIGKAIQEYVEALGYGVVRDLVGHGVGHAVHEDPRVPNFYDKNLEQWVLQEGVVIAIEPMITMGDYQVETAEDGWSISTVDKSLNAHFEHTIIITKDGPFVVTRRPGERIS